MYGAAALPRLSRRIEGGGGVAFRRFSVDLIDAESTFIGHFFI